jgi:hypothetical protein
MDHELSARLDRARAELRSTMTHARVALEAARLRSAPSREELDQLQEDSRSGQLGPDMQRLAGHVAAGETAWSAVFDGTSPYKELLRGHLTAMGEQFAEPAREVLENDPTFDPGETSPGV